jgi:FG-GAP-like repeat/ASPIC and UnbV
MKLRAGLLAPILLFCGISMTCHSRRSSNDEMVALLSAMRDSESVFENPFYPEAGVAHYDSVIRNPSDLQQFLMAITFKADLLLKLGKDQQAVNALDTVLRATDNPKVRHLVLKMMAIGYMRIGERGNCINNHTAESCEFPIRGSGIHTNKTGSSEAIALYEELLQEDSTDLESKWLLNIAFMTIGGYPRQVPAAWLIKGLDADTAGSIKPFMEMAGGSAGLGVNNMAGGSLIEDLDNDGNLDVVTSSWGLEEGMHYSRSNGDGTFTDLSALSGLKRFTGGLNIMQTDYNNDGLKDIFVLRGAWKGKYGREPVSLLRNNGDGTFTDVTKESGLLELHPTQTAVWADFNNDGWLDVFIGSESSGDDVYPCRLFLNNHDGTFTESALKAGCQVIDFVKGVTAGDYNNDGWPDLFISSLSGEKRLLRNDGIKDGCVHFTDVSAEAGLKANRSPTFATWFWDYNNDGWPDILVCDVENYKSLASFAAADALQRPIGKAGRIILYRNNHDGTFTDVSDTMGLNHVVFAMGSNFGDIDNDGYPDMYFGTGNPLYQSVIPNKLFRNAGGKKFEDVTGPSRTGNLQKGHGVSFADIDNDGDEDIYIKMGGAFPGDAYQSLLFVNPGQNKNHWISLDLTGVYCNRPAIGARIKLSFLENGVRRDVFKDVNSGGSFGANPLRQHLGVGMAEVIDSLEIQWPGRPGGVGGRTGLVQVFRNVGVNQFLQIREGDAAPVVVHLKAFTLRPALIDCAPLPAPQGSLTPLPLPRPKGARS